MKKVAILFIVLLTSSFVFAQNTYVPDDKFEQALIDLGYDTTLDDSVLTANISGVTSLNFAITAIKKRSHGISDLTGIEAFVALEELNLWNNVLTSLDLSNNTALTRLVCRSNSLTSLDVSKNTALVELNCAGNQLTSLDVSKNTALEYLYCYYNQLTSLDVSKNTALTSLSCSFNQLTSLNMKNGLKIGAGVNDIFLSAIENSLTCIETLDPVYADTNRVVGVFGTSTTDGGVTFSLSCVEAFEWVSSASDTINITQSNLTDTYNLQWTESPAIGIGDRDSIHYLVYAKIGAYPAEEIDDTTVTALSITYQEILENVFEGSPVNGATVKFQVVAKNGGYSKDVTGDDRVLYVNRYDYLSVENQSIPTEFALHENYPNPFNPTTTLRFDLPEVSDVTVTIFNMLGQKVRTFNYQNTSAGYHSVTWDAANDLGQQVGAGVYLYQLQTKDFVKTRKMVLLK